MTEGSVRMIQREKEQRCHCCPLRRKEPGGTQGSLWTLGEAEKRNLPRVFQNRKVISVRCFATILDSSHR